MEETPGAAPDPPLSFPVPTPAPPEPVKSHRLPSGFSTIRDIVTFVIGLALIIYEVAIPDDVRPYVLAVGLTMAGLPLVFGADEKRKDK